MGLKERPARSTEYRFGMHAESTSRYTTVAKYFRKREVSEAWPETASALGKVRYRVGGSVPVTSAHVLFVSDGDFQQFLRTDLPVHPMPKLAEAAARNRVLAVE